MGIMKATELLGEIRENLKDYPIDYLRNKVTDDRYKDVTVKKLAKYNSDTWDEIFSLDIDEDYDIKDGVVNNIKDDIDFYFDNYLVEISKQGNSPNTFHFIWH